MKTMQKRALASWLAATGIISALACGDDRVEFGGGGAPPSTSSSGAQDDSGCSACKEAAGEGDCAEERKRCRENPACDKLDECMRDCGAELSCLESCTATNTADVEAYMAFATCTNCESCADVCSDCDILHCVNDEMDGDEAGVDCGGAACRECGSGPICVDDEDCETGYCVGVCCTVPCQEACHSCAIEHTDQTNGECYPVIAGTDPRDDCPGSDTCNGGGVCSCADGQLDNGESDVDCGGPNCAGCENGKLCTDDSDCASDHCVDGVCCDEKCDGSCEACVSALTNAPDGTCAPIPGGSDPEAECADEGAESCGDNGQCNGAGDCAKYASGTPCGSPQSCSAGIETKQDTCNGQGSCVDNGTVSCAPFSCGTTSCYMSCSTNSQCNLGYYCDGTACQALKALGQPCANATQCQSGHCTEGVCCNEACNGTCESCKQQHTGQASGSCAAIAVNTDPYSECSAQAQSTCGTTGMCSGLGSCKLWPSGTLCGSAPSCANGVVNLGDACNGSGDCVLGGTAVCYPYVCNATTCFTSCTTDAECAMGRYCELTTATCNPLKAQGASCAFGYQCTSGHCIDGVCCNTACGATCYACSSAKTSAVDGICAPVTNNTDPDNECAAADVCNGAGQCQCVTGTWSCGGCASASFHGQCCNSECSSQCPNEQALCVQLNGTACNTIGQKTHFGSGQYGAETNCSPDGCYSYECECLCN